LLAQTPTRPPSTALAPPSAASTSLPGYGKDKRGSPPPPRAPKRVTRTSDGTYRVVPAGAELAQGAREATVDTKGGATGGVIIIIICYVGIKLWVVYSICFTPISAL
jgi:hypothetical protein